MKNFTQSSLDDATTDLQKVPAVNGVTKVTERNKSLDIRSMTWIE